jgi:uncharacterized protein (TIGR02599 family)
LKPIPKHLVRGFTLLEMMVSIAVLLLLLSILAASTEGVALAFHAASGKLSTYAAARAGFNTLNQTLSQATLNTYLDYYDAGGNLRTQATVGSFVPSTYGRVSNMQFLVNLNGGSASPTGSGQELYFECPAAYSTDTAYHSTQGLLNACGYYVQYGSDATFGPSLISSPRWRYRLMQALEPTENLQVYAVNSASSDQSATWTANIANTGAGSTPAQYALPMAENIIAMIIWPRLPVAQDATGVTLAPAYSYDSQETVAP